MTTDETFNDILKKLGNVRSKLSALFSLYNNSMLIAEDNRSTLINCYEKMIDYKNDLNLISTEISNSKKTERQNVFTKNKTKIMKLGKDATGIHTDFTNNCNRYKLALSDCGSLKTEYKHEVAELCKEFKGNIDDNTPAIIKKGYMQQVKVIKVILARIELLISDYNVKKNKIEEDYDRFKGLYESVSSMIDRLKVIA